MISAKGERVAGTCEWIEENNQYQSWLSDGPRILWISGGPGKGKTVLSIYLTQELERSRQTAYYFCVSNDERRNNAAAVLRGLIWQLVGRQPEVAEVIQDYLDTPEKKQSTLSSRETLWAMVTKIARDTRCKQTFYILDGVDECDDDSRRWLAKKLVRLSTDRANCAFRTAIVSRDTADLGQSMKVKLDSDHDALVSNDIRAFVSFRVQELATKIDFSPKFRQHVEDTFLERACGTFLWVGFAMTELMGNNTCSEVVDTLEELPSGLAPVYGRILRQIRPVHRENSARLLRWVVMAVRPLRLKELASAVGCVPSEHVSTEQAIRDQILHCKSFLSIRNKTVSLVHESAKDYLLREEVDDDATLEMFRVQTTETHLEIAKVCVEAVEQGGILYWYALLHWPEHALEARTLAIPWFKQASFFRKTSTARDKFWQRYPTAHSQAEFRASMLQMHIACFFGLVEWVRLIMTDESCGSTTWSHCSEVDLVGFTPLHCAVRRNHPAVVSLLLEHGAPVNVSDVYMQTPLYAAVKAANVEVVRLLLDNNAEVNSMNGLQDLASTPLHEAMYWEYDEITRLLLDHGADVTFRDAGGDTALHSAARSGREAMVQLLIQYGCAVNARDSSGRTALLISALLRHEPVARQLLDHGANVDSANDRDMTALHYAALKNHEGMVRLLLERGADVNARTVWGTTPLDFARDKNRHAMMELLRAHGAATGEELDLSEDV